MNCQPSSSSWQLSRSSCAVCSSDEIIVEEEHGQHHCKLRVCCNQRCSKYHFMLGDYQRTVNVLLGRAGFKQRVTVPTSPDQSAFALMQAHKNVNVPGVSLAQLTCPVCYAPMYNSGLNDVNVIACCKCGGLILLNGAFQESFANLTSGFGCRRVLSSVDTSLYRSRAQLSFVDLLLS